MKRLINTHRSQENLGFALVFCVLVAGCSSGQVGQNSPLPSTALSSFKEAAFEPAATTSTFLYVANFGDHPTVTLYRTGTKQRRLQISTGQALQNSMVVDSTGRLYVSSYNSISVFTGRNKSSEHGITQGIAMPAALALDAEQNLYVANHAGGTGVEVFSPGGTQLLRTITDGVNQPSALAFDGDGNLYVANWPGSGSASISVYPNGATSPTHTITEGVATPWALAVDAKGTLYVLTGKNVQVYPRGRVSPARTLSSGIETGEALAVDGSGKVYVGGARGVTVYKSGSTALYRTLPEPAQTTALAFDSSGRLYVATLKHKGGVFMYPSDASSPAFKIGQTEGVKNPIALAIGPR